MLVLVRGGLLFGGGSLIAVVAACGLSAVGATNVTGDGGSVDGSSSAGDGALTDGPDGPDGPGDDGGATTCIGDRMTDPANCGACNHDCLGGACVGGACQPTVFVAGESGARGVAVVGQTLLWTRESASLVRSRPLSGGATTTVITLVDAPTDVTGDGQHIWVTARAAGEISKWGADGSSVWTKSGFDTPTGITKDGTAVYYAIQNQDHIESMDLDGNQTQTRMSGLNYPADVAVSVDKIYSASGSGILVAPLAFGTPVTNVSPTSRFKDGGGDLIHTGVTVEGSTIWFTIGSLGTVATVPTSGGAARVLATNQADPEGIAVSANAIYWANQGDGTIMKLAR